MQAARRETRVASPGSVASHSTEDGEIPARPRSPRPASPKKPAKIDLDELPANRQELNGARLGRYELVDIMFKEHFEEVAIGE
jgi:RNA polymerase-associated protein RTF1